jgi:hypothetical protein
VADDFATDDCTPNTLPAGEPSTAFGFWYDYTMGTPPVVAPKAEIYVIKRPDGSHTALKIKDYYDPAVPMRGAVYTATWKQL